MIDLNSRLTIKYSLNGVFTDYTLKSSSFSRDTFQVNYVAATDYLYVGYTKPISSIYINQTSTYDADAILTAEYFDGSTWTTLDISDDTLGFKRSGFIRWQLSQENQAASTVDSTNCYWYRIKGSANRSALIFAGINMVFADDYDLSLEQPLINSTEFLGGQASHILIHAAVRNEILQKFRNQDYIKLDSSGNTLDINAWDLFDILEVRQAAVFLALSKIYENQSDSASDVWSEKAAKYQGKYEKMINIARLSLDLNDDGVQQESEQKPNFSTRYMTR